MNRKILIFCLVILAIVSIGAVCASESITFNSHHFTIPDGYEKTNDSNETTLFYENDEDVIMINVLNTTISVDDIAEEGDVQKTIGGKEGWVSEDEYSYFFIYNEGNGIILIAAPDESVIEEIISE